MYIRLSLYSLCPRCCMVYVDTNPLVRDVSSSFYIANSTNVKQGMFLMWAVLILARTSACNLDALFSKQVALPVRIWVNVRKD